MSRVIRCDRCGKVFASTDEYLVVTADPHERYKFDDYSCASKYFDLCKPCAKEFEKFMAEPKKEAQR